MPDEDRSNVEGRMRMLEAGLNELAVRLRMLEERLGARPQYQAGPPPIHHEPPTHSPQAGQPQAASEVQAQPPYPPLPPPPGQTWTQWSSPPRSHAAPASAADLEYNLGAKVLPWVGAIVLLVAIGYFVSVGIQRGWIGPQVQFWSAMIVSAGFIGVGFWKREEREEFGKLLIGIGSCGVYMTLASGYVFISPRIYEAELLVTLFFTWSLANLSYSYVVSSRAFLTIGLLGGLAAALMPLDRHNYSLNVALHFAIVLPALAIAVKNRWSAGVVGIFAVSTVALVPTLVAYSGVESIGLRVFALFGNSLAACLAYGYSGPARDFDPESAFIPGALLLAGLGALGIYADFSRYQQDLFISSTENLLLMGAVGVASGFAMREQIAKHRFWLGGALVLLVLSPTTLAEAATCWWFAAISVMAAAASLRVVPKAAISIGWVDLALSMAYYIRTAAVENPFRYEVLLLFALMAATVFVAWATNKVQAAEESLVAIAGSLLLVFGSRVIWVAPLEWPTDPVRALSMTFLWVPAGVALVATGARRNWPLVLSLGWLIVVASLVDYLAVRESSSIAFDMELATVLLAMAGAIAAASLNAAKPEAADAGLSVMAAMLWVLVTRLAILVLATPSVGIEQPWAITTSWILYGAALLATGFLASRRSLRFWSFGVFGATVGKVFLIDLSEKIDPLVRVGILALLGMALLAGGYWYIRRNVDSKGPEDVEVDEVTRA